MDWSLLFTNARPPDWEQITGYIDSPLWPEFNSRIQEAYQIQPTMEYSCCSMQRGWNVKYKKSGKSLCTLYPMSGYFIVLVVIGDREMTAAEYFMPLCTNYVQELFKSTNSGHGQKWLMLEVRDGKILEDVFSLISLRKPFSKK